jgi:hypothetical protein
LTKKVKVAVFDKDQKVRKLEMCEIGKDGSKLKINKGGKKHWYPSFDRTSFLEWPKPWHKGGGYERIYLVRNHASQCVNFETQTVPDVDLDEIKKAIGNAGLDKLGNQKQDTPFISWITLLVVIFGILIQMGVFK